MASVFDVASYILEKCGTMPTFKLQKLTYYCQSWYMAWNNKEYLFEEDFEAWINGPVVRDLFNLHRGMYDISKNDILKNISCYELCEKKKNNIDKVLKYYGNKSSSCLVLMTHSEKPWKTVRKNLQDSDLSDEIIMKEDIFQYYKDKQIDKLSMEI